MFIAVIHVMGVRMRMYSATYASACEKEPRYWVHDSHSEKSGGEWGESKLSELHLRGKSIAYTD
jgi:hypothetical protein